MARTVSGRFFSAGVGVWDFVHFQVCSKFHGGTSDHVEQEILGGFTKFKPKGVEI